MQSLQEMVSDKKDTTWISSIRMMFNSEKYSSKSLVILEGPTDIGLYRAVAESVSACDCVHFDSPGDGKKIVLEYVNILRTEGMGEVYGVCDADFDHIRGICYDHIHLTDLHDIEMMMLSPNFIRSFFFEYTLHSAYDASDANELIERINDQIFNACYLIGILKWVSYDLSLMLNFKKLGYHLFVSVSGFDLSLDEDKYIDHVLMRSKSVVSKEFILEKYNEYKERNESLLHVCNGHDFTFLLGLLYRSNISNNKDISHKMVESCLRLKYDLSSFNKTKLYSSIRDILVSKSNHIPETESMAS